MVGMLLAESLCRIITAPPLRSGRFDVSNEKYDPTLKKIYSVKETNNQLLFAAANGDLKALKR